MRQSEIFQSKSFYPNKESHFVVDQRQLAKKESVTMRLNNYMLFTETCFLCKCNSGQVILNLNFQSRESDSLRDAQNDVDLVLLKEYSLNLKL